MENQPVVLGGVDTRSSGGVVLPEGVSAARLDEEGRIAIDLDCIGCQYNLRMCDAQGRCPECGLAVGRSAVGRYLCYHEPKWVQCLAWGMNRFAVALLAAAASIVLGFGGDYLFADNDESSISIIILLLFAACLPCVALGFTVLGVVRATWPNPFRVDREPLLSRRRMCRILSCFSLGFVILAVASVPMHAGDRVRMNWTEFLWALAGLASLAALISLLTYAYQLARMIPRTWLARWTIFLIAVIILMGLVLVFLSDNWFGWYEIAIPIYEKIWPTYTGSGPYAGARWGWSPGAPYYYHEEFLIAVERLYEWSAWLLGISVLGIVPLFFVYWSALHKEAAKAKATWAASPWRGKGEEAAGQLNASMQRGVRAEP